jgi:hypothetical protein
MAVAINREKLQRRYALWCRLAPHKVLRHMVAETLCVLGAQLR